MIIALDNRYKDINGELKKLGYTVVGSEYRGGVEAVLYHSQYEVGFLENINNSTMTSGTNTSGVLLLDIKNKSVGDIDDILKRRLYTPLF